MPRGSRARPKVLSCHERARLRARHRPRHHEHAGHGVRRRGQASRDRADPHHADLPRAGGGRARPRGDLAVGLDRVPRRARRRRRRLHCCTGHHQSARDDAGVGASHGQAARERDRVAGPAHGKALPGPQRRGLGRPRRRNDRPRHRSLFLGNQACVAARKCSGS